jgi:ABC-type multidrug transport system ATPase subunit
MNVLEVKNLVARDPRVETKPVSFAMETGIHALLGSADDGPPAILRALAGEGSYRGSVSVHGGPPAAVRKRIALIVREVSLPQALRVDEVLALAATIRGDAPSKAEAILAPLGLESLAKRAVSSLGPAEQRAVALAEALASNTVDVLLVEEPFADLEATAGARLASALRAKKGCIVIATASTRDAGLLAKDFLILERGRPVQVSTFEEAHRRVHGGSVRFRLLFDDARAWLAAAASEPVLRRLALDGDAVVVEGEDPEEVARAIARAIVTSRAAVKWMTRDVPPLDELRASFAGQYAGVYQAAVARAQASRPAAPPGAAPTPTVAGPPPTPPTRLGGEG